MRKSIAIVIAVSAIAAGSALSSACSSSNEEATPSRPPVPVVSTDDAGTTTDGGPEVDAGCIGPNGCYACAPVQELDYLNACTDGQCTPFDNAARLPLYKAGQPLPAIP